MLAEVVQPWKAPTRWLPSHTALGCTVYSPTLRAGMLLSDVRPGMHDSELAYTPTYGHGHIRNSDQVFGFLHRRNSPIQRQSFREHAPDGRSIDELIEDSAHRFPMNIMQREQAEEGLRHFRIV